MKITRILLVVAWVFNFAVMGLTDSVPNVALALFFFMIAANVVLAVIYAKQTDRSQLRWGVGALLVPYLCLIILALLPNKKSGVMQLLEETTPASPTFIQTGSDESEEPPPNKLFTSFPETDTVFQIKKGWFEKPEVLNVNNLRLASVVITSGFKWRLTSTQHSIGGYYLDLLTEKESHYLYEILETAIMGKNRDCVGITVCLSDFGKQGILLKLTDIRNRYPALLAALYRCRHERKKRLYQWLNTNPVVTLKSRYGTKFQLNKSGYNCGYKLIPWSEVGMLKILSTTGNTTLNILPKGSSGGMFSTFKAKDSISILERKSDLYIAEFNFWRELENMM